MGTVVLTILFGEVESGDVKVNVNCGTNDTLVRRRVSVTYR